MPNENKALVNGAVAAFDHCGGNEDYKGWGMGWLFRIALKTFKKEICRV